MPLGRLFYRHYFLRIVFLPQRAISITIISSPLSSFPFFPLNHSDDHCPGHRAPARRPHPQSDGAAADQRHHRHPHSGRVRLLGRGEGRGDAGGRPVHQRTQHEPSRGVPGRPCHPHGQVSTEMFRKRKSHSPAACYHLPTYFTVH